MDLEVVRVTTPAEMAEALAVRFAVFVEEQGVPAALEIDRHDGDPATLSSALHVLGRLEGRAVATGRLLLDEPDGRVHVGRVAVLQAARGRGYGTTVMLALHDLARQHDCAALTLAAQLHAIGFYERLGYVARGDIFLDAGIEHRWMDLDLG